ncbi:MAG: Multidrug resistance protein MdtB [Chlamydiia bacterium]|nr:Multidrug resistance protein MdtB [Chlamydiia bacterium]MCH9615906.1 Multidrug resistance protein MdtB [Chlamydiia bacterium]MCH9628691.1 Multidrug resistance protein MdtB [Chlamydiia bacterium]
MNLSEPFIRRPVLTCLAMLAMVSFGIMGYSQLSVASIPTIEYPTLQVNTTYPGASAQEIARLVTGPLERQLMLVQGVSFVSSQNTYENSNIAVAFHLDVDINVAATDVQEAINTALAQMPKDLPTNPQYIKSNPSDTPILFIGITSKTMPAGKLYDYGYTAIGQQLTTIEGVANIQTFGFPWAVRVQVDPQAIAAKNITLPDVAATLVDGNPDQPTGRFYGRDQSITILTEGQIYEPEGYGNLILKYEDNGPVRISDVGISFNSLENNKQSFEWVEKDSRTPICFLAVYKQLGYNTVEICEGIFGLVDRLKGQLPDSVDLLIPFNQATVILEAVADVKFTLIVAFILVVLVIFFYLGKFRNSLIPLITLPITLTGSFCLMYINNYSIDIMSMSAFTLAIGFLVDDAIVVLENIVRWIQEGSKPYDGAIKGSNQISITVFSISLCLAAVFLPMFFLQGVIGRIFHEFAAVIIISVLISGFISLTLTPMLCSRFIPPYAQTNHPFIERMSIKMNEKLVNIYKPILSFCIHHKPFTLLVAIASIIASVFMIKAIPKSFLPPDDLGIIQCFGVADEGTSPEKMKRILDEVSDIVMKSPYVKDMARINSYPTDNQAMFFINLVDPDKRPFIMDLIPGFEKDIKEVIDLQAFLKPFPLINLQIGEQTSGKANNQFLMQSFNEELLYESAAKLTAAMQSNDNFAQVSNDMQNSAPLEKVTILRDQAHVYEGLDAAKIENALQYAYGETYVTKMNEPANMYYAILETLPEFYNSPQEMNKVYLGTDGDSNVMLRSVIDKTPITGPLVINHVNSLPAVTISFNQAPGVPLGTAVTELNQLSDQLVPKSIGGGLAGNTKAFQETINQLSVLLILAIFVIYLILGMLYENFLHPLTAISTIPVAAFGGVLTLMLLGESLSVYAFIGLIMLFGIVLKNGIILIDFALEELEKPEMEHPEAIYNACVVRFRPILMTTLAAMMGAVPIALGVGGSVAKGRAPLGMVVVGGLIFSQAVTLFVTPVVFIYLTNFQHWIQRKTHFFDHKAPTEE